MNPVLHTGTVALFVCIGNHGLDIAGARFVVLAHRNEGITPVTVGGFTIGVDLGGARKPLAGAAIDVLLKVDVSDKQSGGIVVRIEQKSAKIAFASLVVVAAGKVGLGGFHGLVDFLAIGEGGFRTIFGNGQHDLQELAFVS